MNATYSPEDNKIRIYPDKRLDPETYARVKSAGFIWAPKQEIFVAPAWTPEREDFAREMCGEIGDEDTSLVERAEERAERFEEYSEKREAEADRAREAVKAIADGIPFGQPILVGHHSEKHARKDAEWIENGMRKAVNLWETSKYWERRAQAAIGHAEYKERPDVRARRIKGLEADLRKQEKGNKEANLFVTLWNRMEDPKLLTRKDGSEVTTLDRARWIADRDRVSGIAKSPEHQWGFTLADTLKPDGERYAGCPSFTPEQARETAVKTHTRSINYRNRWIAHLQNRIAYEKAMLAESGGTVTDRTTPEKGGAVRCWAGPSLGRGWAYIVKVNKVTVTIREKVFYGDRILNVNVPFDKLNAVMNAAQVQEARNAGRLIENAEKTGFFLADSPTPMPRPEPTPDPKEEKFDALKQTLEAGIKPVVAPCLFPTPAELAARMVELANIQPEMRILEPSAGTGNILAALDSLPVVVHVQAVEINLALGDRLTEKFRTCLVHGGDFLEKTMETFGKPFDRILMNPPFDHGSDIVHIQHARKFLKPGGRLVAICAGGPKQTEILKPPSSFWEELPAGTFEGTQVRSVLLVIEG